MNDVVDYLNSKNIKYTVANNEAILDCPECGKPKLSINLESQVYKCWHCNALNPTSVYAKGHLSQLKKEWGDIVTITPLAEPKEVDVNFSDLVDRYHYAIFDKSKLSKSALRYLVKDRGFTEDSIKRFKLGVTRRYHQNWISIPAYEDGIPKLIKYRKLPPYEEECTIKDKCIREAGGKSILFNGDCLTNQDEVILCEGEMDCITLIQNGYENAVTGTAGCETFLEAWYEKLYIKNKFFLVFDHDDKGQGQLAARDVWATRLGIDRCFNVLLPEGYDVNDFFLDHSKDDFEVLLSEATRFKVSGVVSLKDALAEMYLQSVGGKDKERFILPWPSVNKKLDGGLARKRLTVLGGQPGTGKCVKFDTKIIDVNTGKLLSIEDVVLNKSIERINSVNKHAKIVISDIGDYVDSGIQKCYKVETHIGKYVECPDHNKFLTPTGWKKLSDLKVGDRIAVPNIMNVFGNKEIDRGVIRLLAYIIADGGTTHNNSVKYTSADTDLVEDLRLICHKYESELKIQSKSKIDYRIVKRYNKRSDKSEICKILHHYNLMGKYSYEKTIPEELFECKKELIQEFISTLWSGDGWVFFKSKPKKRNEVAYSTSCFELAQQLQHLLLRFGIVATMRTKSTYRRDNYIVSIRSSEDIMLFYDNFKLCERKQKILDELVWCNLSTSENFTGKVRLIPKEYWKTAINEVFKHGLVLKKTYREYKPKTTAHIPNYKRPVYRGFLEHIYKKTKSQVIDDLLNMEISFVDIKAITDIGSHRTYDLSVLENECFIANDILVHNTSFALQVLHSLAKNYSIPGFMFCLEMPEVELATKIVQLERDLTYNEINYSDALIYSLEMGDLPLYFGYSSSVTLDKFYYTMKEVRDRYGVQIGVFDNLQCIARTGEESDIGMASKRFKDMTMELNIPFILISQPRKLNSEENPTYDSLKGSSAIPADADEVILLHRKRLKGDEMESSFESKTRIIIDKGRFSSGGGCWLELIGEKSKFIEMI